MVFERLYRLSSFYTNCSPVPDKDLSVALGEWLVDCIPVVSCSGLSTLLLFHSGGLELKCNPLPRLGAKRVKCCSFVVPC